VRGEPRVPGLANAEISGEKHTATVVFDDQKTTVGHPDGDALAPLSELHFRRLAIIVIVAAGLILLWHEAQLLR
jgi:hypothetical protein